MVLNSAHGDAGDWGVGYSRRTQKSGSFPWSYVEPLQVTQTPHTLEPARFTVPTYCQHCGDFIWGGTGAQSFKCRGVDVRSAPTTFTNRPDCDFICHKKCKFFAESNSALECQRAGTHLISAGMLEVESRCFSMQQLTL